MKKNLLIGLSLAAISVVQVSAQTRTISGRVTDRTTGEGLPGVTVLVKGTTNGVSTNSDGTFSLTAPADATTLAFSSVGYIALERPIAEGAINVALAPDTKQLSEVVVTGYGIRQDIKDLTGSVAQLSGDKILTQPVQSVDQALTGRLSGVQVTTPGGVLGDQVQVRIRGVNSISGSSQPLYVVDGVPIDSRTNLNVFNGGDGTRFNPLVNINPNDIESVQVLKDASAAAIYGSRAANGVIIINTKRGASGKSQLSVNSWVGTFEAVRTPEVLNTADFVTIQNEKANNRTPGSIIARNIDLNGDGQSDETNWLDEIYRRGFSQNHQVSISGGNEKASYYGSVDYSDQSGIILTNRLRRGSARLNLDVTPKTWLKAGVSLSYSQAFNNGVLSDRYIAGATVSGFSAPPNVPQYNPDGTFYLAANGDLGSGNNTPGSNVIFNFSHPRAVLELNRNDNTARRLLTNTYATVEPIKGLTLTTRLGLDYQDNFEDQYSDRRLSGLGRSFNGLVQNNRLDRFQYNWQNYVNYNVLLAEQHNVGVTAGIEYQETQENQLYTGAQNISDPKFNAILDGLFSGNPLAGGTKLGSGFRSYYGNLAYSFGSKYYATATFRADADSRFGALNQTGYFPGGSVGWRISEESFMEGIRSVVSDLKLRASYGKVGNSAGIGTYASRTLVGAGQYADLNGFSITQLGNDELQWESAKKLDVGLDATLLKDRITLNVDYFNTDISGLLLAAPTPRTLGVPGASIFRNIGRMVNQGVEINLNTTNITTQSGFRWTSSINFTTLKNEVKALNDPADIPSAAQRASIGRPLGVYQLIRWAGVNPANGNAQFLDANGNIKQYDAVARAWFTATGDATTPITQADAVYTSKTGYPTYYGGFDNTFSFKGVDLGIFLQYSGGNEILNQTRQGLLSNFYSNNLTEIKDRWMAPGQETDIPKLVLGDNISTQTSTRFLEKGDFLRIRQVTLGYNFATTLLQSIGISQARVYVQGQNLYVFTKYSGADPEVNFNRNNSNIAFGVDNRSVPQTRAYTAGINFTF